MKTILSIVLLSTLLLGAYAENYAVLVAGSNMFYNYRHQSDTCHAYHVLLDHGKFKAENIIVFSYNDVASDSQNPFPNTLYNKPTTGPGVDVNKGCVVDYEGADVTPDNYIKVLKGESMKGVGSGKTLVSTENDNVFLAFFDHGASGLIAFPSSYLYANDLLAAFAAMKYKKAVYYLEACESGSMFVDLPKNVNFYALSASNPTESSWGTYCPPDDVVDGKDVGSCLGDLFSINWMEDSDLADFTQESLQAQFQNVLKTTTMSQVMQWGDVTFTTEPIGHFLGNNIGTKKSIRETVFKINEEQEVKKTYSSIDARNIQLQYLVNKFTKNPSLENKNALQEEIDTLTYFSQKFESLKTIMDLQGNTNGSTNFNCYKELVNQFESQCGKVNEGSYKYFKYLNEMCKNVKGLGFEHLLTVVDQVCNSQ